MFSVALLLALAAFAPILPTSSVDQAAIAVCFATEEDCAALAVRAINNAEREIFSASAELMVSPDCSARCVVRDTRAPGGDRYRWTVTVLGQLDPVAQGRAENRVEARSLAEEALATYFANRAMPISARGG